MKIKNRELFFKYAIPCAGTLVKRGEIKQEFIDELIEKIKNKKPIPKDTEKIFKIAYAMCSLIARKLNKSSIDNEVIRKYFLYMHDSVVDDRFQLMGDFNPEKCRTYSGRVLKLDKDKAVVQTITGQREYRTDFFPTVKPNDLVIVHRDFIIENISEKQAKILSKLKEKYFDVELQGIVGGNE